MENLLSLRHTFEFSLCPCIIYIYRIHTGMSFHGDCAPLAQAHSRLFLAEALWFLQETHLIRLLMINFKRSAVCQ